MKPDYHLAETLIEAIPSMNEMSLMESLEKKIDASNPLAFQLIQWIISSNRSHIVKLPSEKQLDFMQTPYQFLLRHSSPAKEAAFQEAKSKYGSSFAFHGSSIENWHSIIRQGLIKASGTRLQMHGAASGKGIYLSPEFTISMQYSRMGNRHFNENRTESDGQSQFLDSSDISCIALCEVINTPLKKCQSTWLCPVADNVRMRFLFVYQNEVGNLKVNTQDDRYLLPIYIALKHDEDIHKQTQ